MPTRTAIGTCTPLNSRLARSWLKWISRSVNKWLIMSHGGQWCALTMSGVNLQLNITLSGQCKLLHSRPRTNVGYSVKLPAAAAAADAPVGAFVADHKFTWRFAALLKLPRRRLFVPLALRCRSGRCVTPGGEIKRVSLRMHVSGLILIARGRSLFDKPSNGH